MSSVLMSMVSLSQTFCVYIQLIYHSIFTSSSFIITIIPPD